MLVPIPAKPGSMSRFNVVNTSTCPNVLQDMADALDLPVRSPYPTPAPKAQGFPQVQVFDTDVYTVVLAGSARDIPAALSRVPPQRRPKLNQSIFDAYDKWYPKWTFALCCFNTSDEAGARPLMWWYEPMSPNILFFPALDAHDGKVPALNATVGVDHRIAVGSCLPNTPVLKVNVSNLRHVRYSDPRIDPKVRQLLPDQIMGREYASSEYQEGVNRFGFMEQGDFVFNATDVRAGTYAARRELPPGAPLPGGCARSVPAEQHWVDFSKYMDDLERRINRTWGPPKASDSARQVVLAFTVDRGGNVSDLKLWQPSADVDAQNAAMKSVKSCGQLAPLPAGSPEHVGIILNFKYNRFGQGWRWLCYPNRAPVIL